MLAFVSAIFSTRFTVPTDTAPELVYDICQTFNPIKPSIAQLEERGTVICNLSSVLSRGRWFEPGSKDVLFLLISFSPLNFMHFTCCQCKHYIIIVYRPEGQEGAEWCSFVTYFSCIFTTKLLLVLYVFPNSQTTA